jgi:hypothetical protein
VRDKENSINPDPSIRRFFENRFKFFPEVRGVRFDHRVEGGTNGSVPSDQVFLKIPAYLVGTPGIFDGGEPFIKWCLVVSLHVDLREEVEADAVVRLAEVFDFLVGSGFFICELITRKPENAKSLIPILLEQPFESPVLGRVSSLGSGVVDQADLSAITFERNGVTVDVIHFKVVKLRHIFTIF